MKIEIEIPDLEEIYYNYEGCEITGKDLKEIIVDIAIEKFIDQMYHDYMNDRVYDALKNDTKDIIKTHTNDIVDRVVSIVSDEIIKKKSIVNEMPKKSEVASISKEWEDYFITLVDKAIAKRFK